MFNLDNLNVKQPEVMLKSAWARGQIPESPDSFIENLVQRVNRGRFRFELGSSINGPWLTQTQNQIYEANHLRDNLKQRVVGHAH